jgi:diadenylate cyclase
VSPTDKGRDDRRWAALAALAPGTPLRDGLERILRGNTGALIVLGDGPAVDEVCTGGFELKVRFSATRLRELAKMDGAIVVDAAADYIVRAAVHLVPDPALPTDEAGTRHRTAERVARQTGCPVVSVSKSMRIIGLYLDGTRYVLEEPAAILSRANQALATLERYKLRLDEVSGALTALEIEDLATVRDVTAVAQRLEMVRRIAREIEGYMVELGTDGRLLALQLDELVASRDFERQLIVQDYLRAADSQPARRPADGGPPRRAADVLAELGDLSPEELLDVAPVARVLGFGDSGMLDDPVTPQGYRLLAKVPRLPRPVVEKLVGHFGGLQKLLAASAEELQQVEGIGEAHARAAREGLSRLAEVSLLERYV